ncbi:MAG: ExeM/NucH family extracellular endonuclease, partial [Rudaea sp.]|nr:ExeM/NucH family extracellular endonuclease [Rudaea sp.]
MSLTSTGTAYTQNFNTLPTSGSATWSNNSTIPGWYSARTGTDSTIAADNGASNSGNLYSYGITGSSDRALGSIGSSNAKAGSFFWGVRLRNNTGGTLTSLAVSYTGEQWRNSAAAAQTVSFSYLAGSNLTGTLGEFQQAGTAVPQLDFTSPVTGGTAGVLDGNAAANRTAKSYTISGLSIPNGGEIMLRWSDPDHPGSDHGLSIDDFSVTAQGGSSGGPPALSVDDVAKAEGDSGTTIFRFTISLSAPAPAGGVSFDIATADGTATVASGDYVANSASLTIPAGATSTTFDVAVNGDTQVEPDETFFVNITNVGGATVADAQGQGTILNDDGATITRIHDVQGNGAASPMVGATVTVEAVVTATFQTTDIKGFFLQEEDVDADADPNTSEGIFIYCNACPTPVAEGQRVRATGVVSEFSGLTEITASAAGSVIVTEAGNHLNEVTPATITLPIVGDIDAYYEARESMLVRYSDTLTVSEYFEMARYGQVVLMQGGRPLQFTEDHAPNVAAYAAYRDQIARRKVLLDDDNNQQNSPLNLPAGRQSVYHPHANGGFSAGTQGEDFFRGGDVVNNLTGVLHWSWAGYTGTDAWRIRPTTSKPVQFTVANPRPAAPPSTNGAIKAVGLNMLNYFTTIDTTAGNTGPCGPSGGMDCRGADSVAELNRQRERASVVLCSLNADVYGLVELENTTATDTINDLLGAVNARCGSPHPYTFVNTGGKLGSDAIRVFIIYRTGVVAPFGSPLVDLDSIHNRPPTAQTFDVVDTTNPARGQRFTLVVNHFKSKGCSGASGADTDQNDGQACWASRRNSQASRLLSWINSTVIPAAGDPDVLLVGDFNAYANESAIATLKAGGYHDLTTELLGSADAYSYVFDGQLGHLDYAFASNSLNTQVAGVGPWRINSDESTLFDYNDEIRDVGEGAFEAKPDGSALTPPRILFQPATPYRSSDHDPVLVGLFRTANAVNGACGTDNGQTLTVAPTNLCSAGTASVVTGNGPWSWTCSGSNGGSNASCSASIQ